MIYHPEDILDFGVNEGYSLETTYHYMPGYIEWLIKYVQDFEINVDEFLQLPKPIIFRINLPNDNPKRRLAAGIRKNHYGSVKIIANLPTEKTKEINFRFSKELLEILDLKKNDNYVPPFYQKEQGFGEVVNYKIKRIKK